MGPTACTEPQCLYRGAPYLFTRSHASYMQHSKKTNSLTDRSAFFFTQTFSPAVTNVPYINPLNADLNPTCNLLALLGAHHILNVSRIRVNITFSSLDWREAHHI